MEKPTRSSKLSAALVTGLTDKYRYNPYARSTINIILLQVILAILIVLAFGYILRAQQQQTSGFLLERACQEGACIPRSAVEADLTDIQYQTLGYGLIGVILLTIFFGYLTARFALRPTKHSLQFQKQFIGNMAHEIRTPLAIIKTNAEVALMDPLLTPAIRETFETTNQELDRISETINNLLSFDTLVRPSRVSFAEIDISEIARAVANRHASLARSRGIRLSFSTDGPHWIFANTTGVEQVFTNLVKNALNYTPQHADGEVSVSLEGDAEEVKVCVSDTGIGIAKKDLYYIFQPFYRADTSRVRGVGGGTSGLGLAIVNEIVRAHHGKIFVRSALNRGTTIEVTFPKRSSEKEVFEADLTS